MMMNRSNDIKSCFAIKKEEGYDSAKIYERQSRKHLVDANSSSIPYFVRLFTKNAYKNSKNILFEKRLT